MRETAVDGTGPVTCKVRENGTVEGMSYPYEPFCTPDTLAELAHMWG